MNRGLCLRIIALANCAYMFGLTVYPRPASAWHWVWLAGVGVTTVLVGLAV